MYITYWWLRRRVEVDSGVGWAQRKHRGNGWRILANMNSGLAVSVLDLVGMRAGESAGSAIARSVELARHAEQWGYKRYWLGEHHSIAGLAGSATAVLIGHVARRRSGFALAAAA